MVQATPVRRSPKRFIKHPKQWFSANGLLLYILPVLAIPATIKAFVHGNLLGILLNAGGYAAFIVAAMLLRQGLKAEAIYQEKRIASPPKWPLKMIASLIVAGTTFVMAWLGARNPFLLSVAFGSGAFLGMLLSYGLDPRKVKMVGGDHGYTLEEIRKTIDSAQRVILSIENANDRINNREFNTRIDQICDTAKQIVDELEENPAAIRRARKFLLVYLDGVNNVTTGYADTHSQVNNSDLEQNFRTMLDSLDSVFKEQKAKLLQEDLFDLDVQIEVLTKQLKHEGVI